MELATINQPKRVGMESGNLSPWDVTAIVAAGVTAVWPPVVDPTIPLLPNSH